MCELGNRISTQGLDGSTVRSGGRITSRQGFGLPSFLPGLDKLLKITAEVLNPTVGGSPSGDNKGHYCPHSPDFWSGCSLDTGTYESFPGDPQDSQEGNSALITVS